MFDAAFLDPHDAVDTAAWQDLWQRAEGRTPFTHLAFAQSLAQVSGMTLQVAAVREAGSLVAGCLLYTRPGAQAWIAGPAPMARYTGVLLDPVPREGHVLERRSSLDALLRLVTARFPVAALSLAPTVNDLRPFSWASFRPTPYYTYRLDATQPYTPGRNVGKHLKRGGHLQVEQLSEPDSEVMGQLYLHYQQQNRAQPVSSHRLAPLLRHLLDNEMLWLHGVREPDGRLIGAQAVLQDDRFCYTWLGGSAPGPAMTLMIDHSIRQAHRTGRGIDLLGANSAAIAQFKKSFGGTLTTHYHAVYYRNRWLAALGAIRPLA